MESWFLADVETIKTYYGSKFREKLFRGNPQIEQVPKRDVLERLANATRATEKGKYNKTAHAPALLRQIDPSLVRKASPNCERIFVAVHARLKP